MKVKPSVYVICSEQVNDSLDISFYNKIQGELKIEFYKFHIYETDSKVSIDVLYPYDRVIENKIKDNLKKSILRHLNLDSIL